MKDNIGKMYLFQFFYGMYFLGGVIVPFFTDWGGLSFRDITLLQAWFVFWMFALEVPTGVIADRFGRKLTITVGCAIFILRNNSLWKRAAFLDFSSGRIFVGIKPRSYFWRG